MKKISFKNPKTYIVLLVDASLFYGAYLAAYWLRFEELSGTNLLYFEKTVLPVVAVQLGMFVLFGLHAGMWRYTGLVDFTNILKAITASFVLIVAGLLYFDYPGLVGRFSRSVFIIDSIIAIGLIVSFRLAIRVFYQLRAQRRDAGERREEPVDSRQATAPDGGGKRATVIYRADDRGEQLLRLISSQSSRARRHKVVGFLDERARLEGASIHGIPVLGPLERLEEFIEKLQIKELLIASRAEGVMVEKALAICRAAHIDCRVVPSYFDQETVPLRLEQLRDIRIDDLLSREPVALETDRIGDLVGGVTVMVTGAGGSIGSELAKQIVRYAPSRLVMVDLCENYLHDLQMELEGDGKNHHLICADVTDRERMTSLFETYRPTVIYHAAAHKHVPLMEANKGAALSNNLGGIKVITDLAELYGVDRLVLVSTDKAVEPSNIMGATKRLCELYLQERAFKSGVRFMAVRFGNVLGSNGSVIPTFIRQIEKLGPVTVTHPDMERYFMTIPEAVGLILQTSTFGNGGELFLLDMGEPVKIVDLAEKMIRIAGYAPYDEIDIVFTGLRPGEKITEKLVNDGDDLVKTPHSKIWRVVERKARPENVGEKLDVALTECHLHSDEVGASLLRWLADGTG